MGGTPHIIMASASSRDRRRFADEGRRKGWSKTKAGLQGVGVGGRPTSSTGGISGGEATEVFRVHLPEVFLQFLRTHTGRFPFRALLGLSSGLKVVGIQ